MGKSVAYLEDVVLGLAGPYVVCSRPCANLGPCHLHSLEILKEIAAKFLEDLQLRSNSEKALSRNKEFVRIQAEI